MSGPTKLIILDRDGVINEDSDAYIKTPDEWIAIPGSLNAIARLNQLGYAVWIATNQSGLARGYFDADTLDAIHTKMLKQAEEAGAAIAGIVFCPHGPDDGCDCRKPKPGLFYRIAEESGLDLTDAPAVGDSLRDLEAAIAAGSLPILVRTGKGRDTEFGSLPPGTQVFDDLAAVVDALEADA